jgi:hypothetical protein
MRELSKWPRLLVTGEPVTVRQAEKIIVWTNEWRSRRPEVRLLGERPILSLCE